MSLDSELADGSIHVVMPQPLVGGSKPIAQSVSHRWCTPKNKPQNGWTLRQINTVQLSVDLTNRHVACVSNVSSSSSNSDIFGPVEFHMCFFASGDGFVIFIELFFEISHVV